MPARRDTRIEASRLRRLSPLQTVEDQSRIWGIGCHSCTWRKGLTPLWKTELQGESSPHGLPGSLGFLSTNGSHFDIGGVDLCATAIGLDNHRNVIRFAKHNPSSYFHHPPALSSLIDLGIAQLRVHETSRLRARATRTPCGWE